MAYATLTDFLNALKEDEGIAVGNPADDESFMLDTDRVLLYLETAADEIHTKIGGRYVTPLVNPAAYLVYANVVIARKQMDLYVDREKVRKDYDDVILNLEKIGAGKGVLLDSTGNPALERTVNANTGPVFMALDCV